MNAATKWMLRWRGLPLLTVVFAAVVLVQFLVRASTGRDSFSSWPQMLVLGLLLVLVLGIAVHLLVMLAGVDPDAATIAARLTSEPDQRRLLSRWIRRTRWTRNVGGIAGITWWVLGTSGQGDLLLCGVGGIALGSMVAQLHHVRPPVGPRTASLERRSVTDYIPVRWRRRMMAVAAASATMIAGGVTVTGAGAARWWGLASLVALGTAHLVQRRVAARPRPALNTGLQHADDLARGLAIDRGLAQPATYFALALFAHGAGSFEPGIGGAATIVSVAAWLYALYLWWHNRRLGLDHLLETGRAASAVARR